jgi:hypothetical protein
LFWLALGDAGLPVYVSETRNLYLYKLDLLPAEASVRFAVAQVRGGARRLFEGCVVTEFELQIVREQAVKLKLDIRGEQPPAALPYQDIAPAETGERFMGDSVAYRIDGAEHTNIYGLTISVKKEGGVKTEARIHRVLGQGTDFSDVIDTLTVTAFLLQDQYEERRYGMFRLTLTRLTLASDETIIDCADAIIGPLRYYVAGKVYAEVFTATGEAMA